MDNPITLEERGNIATSTEYFSRLHLPKTAKILDIGCRFGSLINGLYEAGYENVYGLDVNAESVAQGREHYPHFKERLFSYSGEQVPFEANTFDAVLMFDVIEHIPEVQSFLLSQVNRVLKPGGVLVFQTPNKVINVPWEIMNKKSFTKYKSIHCSLQTLGSLKQILHNANFDEVRVEKFNITTEHNLRKMKRVIGPLAKPTLNVLQKNPLVIFPNFWGIAKKRVNQESHESSPI